MVSQLPIPRTRSPPPGRTATSKLTTKMKLRLGLNRPPPLVKRQNYGDEVSHNTVEKVTPGKWHLPLRTKRRHSPFRQKNIDHDHFTNETYAARYPPISRSSGQRKGEFLENEDEFKRSSRRFSHRGTLMKGQAGLTQDVDPPTNEDWCDIRTDARGVENSYRGGYDFRDDIESINSWEEERRRRYRMAEARKQRLISNSRDPSPPVSTVRKIIQEESRELPANSNPRRDVVGYASRRIDNRNSTTQGGSTVTSTIATNEDDLSLNRSISTFSHDSGINPQLLHAKAVPELPPGYLQRNDGVVISLGSSIISGNKGSERYSNIDEQAEIAAQNVVEDLRALGYKVDERNGILGSNSDSGQFSKFRGPPSWTLSTEAPSARSNASVADSTVSHSKVILSKETDHGIQRPPGVMFRSEVPGEKAIVSSGSVAKDFLHRAKVRTSSNDAQSNGSRKSINKVPIDAQSNSSRRSNVKASIDAQSNSSRRSNVKASIDAQSNSSRKSNVQASIDAQSNSSRKSNVQASIDAHSNSSRKPKVQAPIDAQSISSRKSNDKATADVQSNSLRKTSSKVSASAGSGRSSRASQRRSPPLTVARTEGSPFTSTIAETETELEVCISLREKSQSEDATDTKDSTIMADGSTLTSRPEDPAMIAQSAQMVFDLQTPQLITTHPTESLTERMTMSAKRVNFSGEFPEVTSEGDRVPELVTKVDGLATVLSDISHQRSAGASTLSSLTFNNPVQHSFTNFCDKVLYSCRISAFPSTRGGQ